jgi:hypothetical protein
MTVVAFLLIVAAVVVMVWYLRRCVRDAVARMEAQVLQRQVTLDKQAKVHIRNQARVLRGVSKLEAKTHVLHKSVQVVLCDPKVQRALNEGLQETEGVS